MTMQLRPSMVKPSDLSRAARSLAYDKSGTGKVARDVIMGSLAIGTGGVAVGALSQRTKVKLGIHGYKLGVRAAYSYLALKPVLPAIRGDKKIGFRFGSRGVMPLGALTGPLGMYVLPHMRRLPVPTFGFGFTAVPIEESRLPGRSKSRGGEHTTSSGTPETATKTIVGPLAKTSTPIGGRTPITPRGPQRGYGGDRRRQKRPVRPRRTLAPYCWRHKKRHYCRFTK